MIISFALSGAVLLVTGLVFVGGHVFSKIIKNKVNQVSSITFVINIIE